MAGTYVYELKVVDDRANWSTSQVTVNVVNSLVSNIPPVTNAGSDVATATTTANLNGATSYDPDGKYCLLSMDEDFGARYLYYFQLQCGFAQSQLPDDR